MNYFLLLFLVLFESVKAQDIFNFSMCAAVPRFMTEPRIVGGQSAPYPIPYQVSLRKGVNGEKHFCGGSILDRRTILTAAHCFDRVQNKAFMSGYFAMAGATDKSHDYPGQVIEIARVIMNEAHPFTRRKAENDVAILKLKSDLVFNDYVQPVCLPDKYFDPVGAHAYASGWGKLDSKERTTPKDLQWVRLEVQSHAKCNALWPKEINYYAHICAGDPLTIENVCNGDSGGPLMVPYEGKAVLVGVASFVSSRGCAYPKYPAVFARVTTYLNWIKMNMENYNVHNLGPQ